MPRVSKLTRERAYRLQDIEEFMKDHLTLYLDDGVRQKNRSIYSTRRNYRSADYIIDHAGKLLLFRNQKPCSGLWVTWIQALACNFYCHLSYHRDAEKNLMLLEFLLKQDGSTLSYVQHPDFHGIDPWVTTQRRATIYPSISMCKPLQLGIKEVTPEMISDFHWFHRILLAYGNKPDSAWFPFLSEVMKPGDESFGNYRSKDGGENLFDLADAGLSLMDHKDMLAACRLQDVKYEVSLKKLCRNVLYKCVPERKMALHAQKLPLPKLLKDFLMLKQ